MNLLPVHWIFLHPDAEPEMRNMGKPVDSIVEFCGLVSSKSEGRRSIEGGAVRINDIKVNDPLARIVYDVENKQFFVVQRERFSNVHGK